MAYAQPAQHDETESDFLAVAELEPEQPRSTIAMSLLSSDCNQRNKEKELVNPGWLRSCVLKAFTFARGRDLLARARAVHSFFRRHRAPHQAGVP
jgi:hypothetical protein